jgi:hypothetical protein
MRDAETRAVQVLAHLRAIANANDGDVLAPYSATQPGIADALQLTRANVSRIMLYMIHDGQVTETLRHVQGFPRRMLSYRLPQNGGYVRALMRWYCPVCRASFATRQGRQACRHAHRNRGTP